MSGRSQVERWAGAFGRAYTDRNVGDRDLLAHAFATMFEGLSLRSVLEVGCNRGHNLAAIARTSDARLAGVDVNPHALAVEEAPVATLVRGEAAALPFPAGSFELVFTVGVLIHVPPDALDDVLGEILRVSSRYVLAVEYFAEREQPVHYRGHDDLLWKRDFEACYRQVEPGLTTLRSGYWAPEQGFDRTHWWLLERV